MLDQIDDEDVGFHVLGADILTSNFKSRVAWYQQFKGQTRSSIVLGDLEVVGDCRASN